MVFVAVLSKRKLKRYKLKSYQRKSYNSYRIEWLKGRRG